MNFFPALVLFSVIGLIGFNAVSYYRATGSVADRLSAAWKGSLTIFAMVWGAVVSTLVTGLDTLAQVTGDPQFASVADAVKQVIPAQYHPLFPAALAAIGIAARLRTAGK